MIIITGITGQDGAYLARHLLSEDKEVVGILRRPKKESHLDGLKFLAIEDKVMLDIADLTDFEAVVKLIDRYKPECIYNLAAQSSVGRSFKYPQDTLYFNTVSVCNLLEAIVKRSPLTKFYQASSSEIYGNVEKNNLPVNELTTPNPISPYGLSKYISSEYVKYYKAVHDIYAVNGILFNHESALRRDGFVLHKVINGLLDIKTNKRMEPITLGNTSVVRDWGYAPSYVVGMTMMMKPSIPKDFILCSGNKSSLCDLIDLICDRIKIDRNYIIHDSINEKRVSELNQIFGTNSLAKFQLNWNYPYSNKEFINALVTDYENFRKWKESK